MFRKDKLIKELEEDNAMLRNTNTMLLESGDGKDIGVITVEIPPNTTKERTDEILNMVKQRMNEEMKILNVDMDWIVLPSIVKTVQIIYVNKKV